MENTVLFQSVLLKLTSVHCSGNSNNNIEVQHSIEDLSIQTGQWFISVHHVNYFTPELTCTLVYSLVETKISLVGRCEPTDRQAGRQTDRETDRQKEREREREREGGGGREGEREQEINVL